MTPIQEEIIRVANTYIGESEIAGNNAGFKDAEFEARLKTVGWNKGQAWCSYFVELVWKQAYASINGLSLPLLDKLFCAMAVKNLITFKQDGRFTIDLIPEPGSVVIWQNYKQGKPDWTGHAGIVVLGFKDGFKSIEGNTNSHGGREGIEVALKDRLIKKDVINGLLVKGFIHPIDPIIF